MDPEILSIRLSEEAKRWDEMVDRLEEYFSGHLEQKKRLRASFIEERARLAKGEAEEKVEEVAEKENHPEEEEELVDETHIDEHGIIAKVTYQE
jgi:hypothetical protein